MTNLIKKYLAGIGLFLIVLFIAANLEKVSYLDIGPQSAAAFNPATLPSDAKPASGFAWNDNIGWINFGDNNSATDGRVYVSNNKLYGYAWGENVGWISLSCDNDSSCGTVDYGVTQDTSNGILTGYAWGENIGWINFNPAGGGVTVTTNISGTNTFSGYAWGENIGWVSFSGTSPNYGVTTTWTRPSNIVVPDETTSSACTYDDPAWSVCTAETQSRTLTAQNSPCTGETSKLETQACTMATSTPVVPITISLSPTTVDMHVNATTTFISTVMGTTSEVLWSIQEGSVAGTITPLNNSSSLFTAGNATGTYHLIARVKADPTKSANATITVSGMEIVLPVNIAIDPKKITTQTNDSILFKSFIINTDNKKTTWIVTEEGGGTIDDSGLYTAPSIAGIFHIKAIAQADISKSDIATIDVRLTPVVATTTQVSTATTTTLQTGEVAPNNVTNNNTGGGGGPESSGGSETNASAVPAVLNVSKLLTDNVAVFGTTTKEIVLAAQKIVESPVGSAVTKTISTVGVVGGGVAASSVIVLNGTATTDLLFLPFKLWGLLLSVLGLKKRNRPWGTVYDSVTKQPIDPAYVTIKNVRGKGETTSITDLDGRYGFLVSPGKYTLAANKTNYTFPSKKAFGKAEDVLYSNLYFGEVINVETVGALISKNIPLDPVKFDWNEFVKGQKKMMKFYSRRQKLIRIVTDWIFRIGFVVSILSLFLVSAPYNLIIFGLYLILALLRKVGLRQKALGALTEKNGDPLSFAVIRVLSPDLNNMEIASKVADRIGRYYCLVPKGKYYVKIEKKNNDESYTEVLTSKVFEASNGIISKDFVI